jgi:transposase-like protein
MLQRIRLALQGDNGGKLSGEVEVDETFIGGKSRNMHKDRRERAGMIRGSKTGKVAVMGLLQRHGNGSQMRAKVVNSIKRTTLDSEVRSNVQSGSTVYTDSFPSYARLTGQFVHQFVDHAECYVDGQVHTNGCENFWSLLKRSLNGTYVSVEPFHMFRYLDEQVFRFNNRTFTDAQRFALAIKGILGKRLTYAELIADDAGTC